MHQVKIFTRPLFITHTDTHSNLPVFIAERNKQARHESAWFLLLQSRTYSLILTDLMYSAPSSLSQWGKFFRDVLSYTVMVITGVARVKNTNELRQMGANHFDFVPHMLYCIQWCIFQNYLGSYSVLRECFCILLFSYTNFYCCGSAYFYKI